MAFIHKYIEIKTQIQTTNIFFKKFIVYFYENPKEPPGV